MRGEDFGGEVGAAGGGPLDVDSYGDSEAGFPGRRRGRGEEGGGGGTFVGDADAAGEGGREGRATVRVLEDGPGGWNGGGNRRLEKDPDGSPTEEEGGGVGRRERRPGGGDSQGHLEVHSAVLQLLTVEESPERVRGVGQDFLGVQVEGFGGSGRVLEDQEVPRGGGGVEES